MHSVLTGVSRCFVQNTAVINYDCQSDCSAHGQIPRIVSAVVIDAMSERSLAIANRKHGHVLNVRNPG